MEERYTVDQLAHMSDDELVRRQFALRNLNWLGAVLILFSVIRFVEFAASAGHGGMGLRGPLLAFNEVFNFLALIAVAAAQRRPRFRRAVPAMVLGYCFIQFFCVALPPTDPSWIFACFLSLLYAKFRVRRGQTIVLFAIFSAATISLAIMTRFPRSEGMTPLVAAVTSVALSHVFLIGAAVLQIVGTKRTRREILREWLEPLQSAREQVRMRDELRYARELQLAMLPDAPPPLDWLDIAASSIPAAEVGGDYYDFFSSEDRIAIVACDVAGHGMPSGLVLAAMRGGLTLLRHSMNSPAAVLAQLHDLVSHTSRQRLLATAAMVMIDRTARGATIASAGHPPLVFRHDATASTIDLYAPPLGVRLPVQIEERTFAFEPGDVLVLHSDGVYETRNPAGEQYGLERLTQLVASHANADAPSLRDAILRDVDEFRGVASQEDDVTVVVVRML
ncbi:MAG: PP2C family protein-serine/threonine phosphatase [Acidobacteriota bacterium]|nr:PP2C family protein-serine/threonine phosphatase [Acidobacteriota bacterium]